MKASLTLKYGLICSMLAYSSCYPGRITLTVLEPARIMIPASITKISLFPGAGIPDLPGVIDSINNIELNPVYNYNHLKRAYMAGLYDRISASPRFLKVVPADSTYENLLYSGIISCEELRQLCIRDSTNAVLMLKNAVSHDTLVRYNYPELFCGIVYRLINHTKWTFCQPFQPYEHMDFVFADTSIFEQEDESCDPHATLLNTGNILYDAFYSSGTRAAEEICPTWNTDVPRIFYTGPGRQLRQASLLVINNQWTEAAELWNKAADSRNRRMASRASFNLALAWEQDDDLDQAYLWISHADSLLSSGRTLAYKKTLETRLKKRDILDQQMSR